MAETSKRSFYRGEIKRLNDVLHSESVLIGLNQFEADEYIKVLDSNFEAPRQEHSVLTCNQNTTEEQLKNLNAEYTEIEKIFISLKAKLRVRSEKCEYVVPKSESASSGDFVPKVGTTLSVNQLRPKLKITWDKFSGDYDKWLVFYTNFNEAMKSDLTLDDAEKYQILLDSTEGKAQALVKRSRSIDKAWDTLKTFYGNACRQATATLNKLWKIEAIKLRTAEAISMLIEQVDGYVYTLKKMIGNDDFTELIPLIVIEKLDATTKQVWYYEYTVMAPKWAAMITSRNEGKAACAVEAWEFIPDWQHLRCFLLKQVDILKPVSKMRNQSGSQMRRTDNTVQNQSGSQMRMSDDTIQKQKREFCSKCGIFHRLYKCESFKSMSLSSRWQHVNEYNLCVRCLHPYHVGPCRDPDNNKPCEACKPDTKYHNSTLCQYVVTHW